MLIYVGMQGGSLDGYMKIRSRYRIGERLRPCPGCPDCQPDPRQRHKSWVNLPVWCDGSGVLPARRKS